MEKKRNNKGFTLAELLIVVAIIAVLVAIAIPIFTNQLEKSREATDLSNIRAAYAEAVSTYLSNGATTATSATVNASRIKQQVSGWQTSPKPTLETRVSGSQKTVSLPNDVKGKTVKVTVAANGTASVSAN